MKELMGYVEGFYSTTEQQLALKKCSKHVVRSTASNVAIRTTCIIHIINVRCMSRIVDSLIAFRSRPDIPYFEVVAAEYV
jgi:hypothetical protein